MDFTSIDISRVNDIALCVAIKVYYVVSDILTKSDYDKIVSW